MLEKKTKFNQKGTFGADYFYQYKENDVTNKNEPGIAPLTSC